MIKTTSFPTLFKTDARGVTRSWTVETEDNVIRRTYGVVGGKMTTSEKQCKAMNVGRANETTASQQAELEAHREWVDRIDEYKPDPKDKKAMKQHDAVIKEKQQAGGQNRAVGTGGKTAQSANTKKGATRVATPTTNIKLIKPMLLQKYDADSKACAKYFDLDIGVIVEPKFDGIHVIAMVDPDTDSVVFASRNLKLFPHLDTLKQTVRKFIGNTKDINGNHIVLDGEVYAHNIIDDDGNSVDTTARFQAITSSCKVGRSEPHQYEEWMNFHVFDIVDSTKLQMDRITTLEEMFKTRQNQCKDGIVTRVFLCPYTIAHSNEDIVKLHDTYVKEGYEGAVIRAKDAMYEPNKRSLRVRKYKTFDDDEFAVIGAEGENGDGDYKNKKLVVWVCETAEGVKFNCVPTGGDELRNKWWEGRKKHIGKMLTVKFQGFSDKGVPRFPIGVAFRTDNIE